MEADRFTLMLLERATGKARELTPQFDDWVEELYEKWNPARYIDKFKTPTLVVTSEKDFRVPFGQGLQFFTALQLKVFRRKS